MRASRKFSVVQRITPVAMNYSLAALAVVAFVLFGCTDTPTSTPIANKRPETHLALSEVNTVQSSRVHVHWYGDDPDGLIAGYVYSWNNRDWYFTRKNDSLFSLTITVNDSNYVFAVAAVDNSAAGRLPADDSAVPFVDNNGDGIYTNGEEFTGLSGATDPSPAVVQYRIVNSAPLVFLGADSSAAARAVRQVPDTTFTVATFLYSVYDTDGRESISAVEWALNDSSAQARWTRVAPSQTLLTVRESDGLRPNADNVLYLRAIDNGGLRSTVLQYPAAGGTWFVKKPKGDVLVVKDYGSKDADAFYSEALNSIAGGRFAGKFDIIDIREGLSPSTRPKNLPLFISPAFIETLKLFRAVIWYGDTRPDLTLAQQVLPDYNRAGGKVIMTTGLPTTVEATGALVDFAPVDSVSAAELPGFPQALKNGSTVSAETPVAAVYPDLVKEKGNVAGVHVLYPRATASALYRLPENAAYTGQPIVGVRSGQRDMVFINVPLHLLNAQNSARTLLERVLTIEFGL